MTATGASCIAAARLMRTGVGTGGGGAAGGDIGARSGLGHGLRQGQQHAPLAHVGGAHRQMEGQAAQRSILQHQGQRAGIVQMGQEMIAADSLEPLDRPPSRRSRSVSRASMKTEHS
ncbi:hypothetical protein, partial [Paracoccus sp. PAMC 22219]|uniref:hypothetical protein n=1 Tax=Paracoccus sp. PAMC 22219 TaxID=1569209 RepID=UPI0005A77709